MEGTGNEGSGSAQESSGVHEALAAMEGLNVSQETSDALNAAEAERTATPEGEGQNPDPSQAMLFNQEQQPEGEGEKQPEANPDQNDGGEQAPEGAEGEAKKEENPTVEEVSVESPLFGGKKTIVKANEPEGAEAPSVENMDQLSSHLKETYGVDDLAGLDTKIEAWQSQEKELETVSNAYKNAEDVFKNMNPDLYKAVLMDQKGEDFRSFLSTSSLDLSKDVASFEKKALVEAFSPGKVSSEDWEEFNDPDGDPNVTRLVQNYIDNSTSQFKNKQEAAKAESAKLIASQQDAQVAFASSVDKSAEVLKSSYSDIDPSLVGELQDMVKNNEIGKLFYDENGNLREDALVNLAMAKHGTGLIDQYQKIMERKIETKLNQDLLARTSNSPSASQGSAASRGEQDISDKVKEEIASIKGLI